MKVYGLTGGIATGKSTCSQMLDVHVLDCDKMARQVADKGCWGWRRVRSAFKDEDVFHEDGSLDRKKMGRLVFSNTELRARLNRALHLPVLWALVRGIFMQWLACKACVVVDMPLLFETRSQAWMSGTVVVVCAPDQQVERLCKRDGIDQASAEEKIAAQMPLERKVSMATWVVNNSYGIEDTQQQVLDIQQAMRKSSRLQLMLSPIGLLAVAAVVGRAVFFRLPRP